MAIGPSTTSSYLELLPAIFSRDPESFLGRFLLAFEQVLTGLSEGEPDPLTQPQQGQHNPPLRGLEEIIASIATLFDPRETREEFLPWLASWVALALRADWTENTKRDFLANIVPLYRKRGTKAGLVAMLRTYTGMGVEVYERQEPLQVGVVSTVGVNTMIDGAPPHYFLVKLLLEKTEPTTLAQRERIARAIIEQEKPAHTSYNLLPPEIPALQIGVHSTIGIDTLLGIQTG